MIIGKNIDELYVKAIEKINNYGKLVHSDRGDTKEILHQIFFLENPHLRWLQQRYKPISIAYSLAELIWLLSGSKDAKIINYWNPSLPKFAGTTNEYPGSYGYRLSYTFNIDQLKQVFLSLKNNPMGRQNVLLYWNPLHDLPNDQGKPKSFDIPCNICSIIKIRDNMLDWTQIMRSNDIYLGFPYDVAQFTNLQEIVSGWLNVRSGTYCHFSDSLHFYTNKKKFIKQVSMIENNDDYFSLSYENTMIHVKKILNIMKKISYEKITKEQLEEFIFYKIDNGVYQNLYYIILAYVAYRYNFFDIEQELINKCTNNTYIRMWDNWKCK